MTINIIQTITNILSEDRVLISSGESEGYILIPDEGKILKNKITGELFFRKICIYQSSQVQDFIEIDKPKQSK